MKNYRDCPTHHLTGQTFSQSEMRHFIEHNKILHICEDCLRWFRSQLVLKNETKVLETPPEPQG
jgi:hypothetical protein